MATIQKFLFEEDFDGGATPTIAPQEPELPPEPPPPPPPPPPPTFSVEQLQQQVQKARDEARASALEEGRAQGRQQAETEAQQALTQAFRAVEGALGGLVTTQNRETALRRENTNRLVLAIMRKLWPAFVARHGQAEVEEVITTFLEELAEEPQLVFRVHERWFADLRDRIADMATHHGFAGQVSVIADPKLGEMDVRAAWAAGGAERDTTALWSDIERIAGNVLAGFPGGPADAR
ncbi:FliH/SctL family protein [Niveispirillum irakense]|uniref:FliH/SctL family protein n=1 Tax=Niveispirillum irakense TaxID=34011 RepID=UPI00040F6973|nr:FliH/SctL family protein [Niveispirillum irakense]